MKYFQLIRITGDFNKITYDEGLKSTEAEPKRLIACHVQMQAQAATDDNDIQGYHERAKVFDIPEKLIATQLHTETAQTQPDPNFTKIPVDLDIPVGETFKAALKCAATETNMRGMYEYEIIS